MASGSSHWSDLAIVVMTFTSELDTGLLYLLESALPIKTNHGNPDITSLDGAVAAQWSR
jgi:hypothetical protein